MSYQMVLCPKCASTNCFPMEYIDALGVIHYDRFACVDCRMHFDSSGREVKEPDDQWGRLLAPLPLPVRLWMRLLIWLDVPGWVVLLGIVMVVAGIVLPWVL